jgi:hypothetical protein
VPGRPARLFRGGDVMTPAEGRGLPFLVAGMLFQQPPELLELLAQAVVVLLEFGEAPVQGRNLSLLPGHDPLQFAEAGDVRR